MMDYRTMEKSKSIRMIVLLFCVLSLIPLSASESNAISGYLDTGTGRCYAYQWSVPAIEDCNTNESYCYSVITDHVYDLTTNNVTGIPACKNVTLKSYYWDDAAGYWVTYRQDDRRTSTIDLRNELESRMQSLNVPAGQYPSDYWSDGPPEGCQDATCADEEQAAIAECGADNWEWTDQENCEYRCLVPPNCTPVDQANASLECGESNYDLYERPGPDPEFPECYWICKDNDCSAAYQDMLANCYYGVIDFNWETCIGRCMDCNDARKDVEDICRNRGGIHSYKCTDTGSLGAKDIKYLCSYDEPDVPDGETSDLEPPPEDTQDGISSEPDTDPEPDPENPDNQPAGDVVDEPDATDADKTNNRLDNIAQNENTQVDQNNDMIGQLNTIEDNQDRANNNLATIANNQGSLQDEIQHNSEVNRDGFASVVSAIGNQETTTTNIGTQNNYFGEEPEPIDFSELATSNPVPTLTGDEFNSDLPTDNDYTEFDDNTTLASDQATAFAEENLTLDPENCPINAEVTASGDPCLNGNITVHQHQIPVSICFNKPWMLEGYAVMKILMIGLAYLQTAMLLNKAIVK